MSASDTIQNARLTLAELHREVSEFWIITRKGATTAEADEQFDAVTSRILDLGVSLDKLLAERLQREIGIPTADTDDDELDPSDPQRMTIANWPAEQGISSKTARSTTEEPHD